MPAEALAALMAPNKAVHTGLREAWRDAVRPIATR
jgi:hypothetical protein